MAQDRGATLPGNFGQNHIPNAIELLRIIAVTRQATNYAGSNATNVSPTVTISTGATWFNAEPTATTFTKYGDSTQSGSSGSDLLIFMTGSFYVSAGPTYCQFGLKVATGTVIACTPAMLANVASVHHQTCGIGFFGNGNPLPAGTYQLQAQAQRYNGTGTVTIDSGDTVSWFVLELPH